MDNQELQQFIGSDRLTVAEAMRRIDGNTYGILFLTDEGGHLKSCLTDGDIRRYLLSGGNSGTTIYIRSSLRASGTAG